MQRLIVVLARLAAFALLEVVGLPAKLERLFQVGPRPPAFALVADDVCQVLQAVQTCLAEVVLARQVVGLVENGFGAGVPLAIISFIAMLALVVQIAPDMSAASVAIAEVVGWIGARADDLATALIVGFAPLFISLAGRGEWLPTWLVRWGYLAGLTGLLSVAAIYSPTLTALGFIIVPVGLGWMLAAGFVLLRRSSNEA